MNKQTDAPKFVPEKEFTLRTFIIYIFINKIITDTSSNRKQKRKNIQSYQEINRLL